ncbi:MAG: CCA tRNA nucleotidyltransferase [Phycisphaerae bacterium]
MARPATKSAAMYVLKRLRSAGFEALFAGGSVRDMLLGRKSYDYDVATNATPKEVERLFPHVLLVGAQFGVAMVIHQGRRVEVTTFRSDESYSDGRRPDAVRFSDAKQDALRRDFTINGMFYDPIADEVIDYIGGREDLKRGVIRTIGKPDDRFDEDYLRMIRAVRFAVRLGFSIEPSTAEGIRKYAANVKSVSGERIFEELWRMLAEPSAAEALRRMAELGLAGHVLGELFEAGAWEPAVERVEYVASRRDPILTLAATLVDLPPRNINAVTRRWGASNELRNAVRWMHEHLRDWRRAEEMPLRELKRLMASEHFERLRRLWRFQERRETGRESLSRRIAGRVKSIPADAVAPPPLITGADLMEMGVASGPEMGRILREIYDAQLDENIATRDEAIAMAQELAEAMGKRQ